jgi:hypothetical protein
MMGDKLANLPQTPISGMDEIEARRSFLLGIQEWYDLIDKVRHLEIRQIVGMPESELMAMTNRLIVQGENMDRIMEHIEELTEKREEVDAT